MSYQKSRPTLEEIAEAAGVSRSTVSRVVNKHPNVRPEVRERVWQMIEKMGYHPNAAARSLASRRSYTLGVVIPRKVGAIFADPYFPVLIEGISDAATDRSYHLMLSLFNRPVEEGFYRRVLWSRMLDGLLISALPLDHPLPSRLIKERVPFVIIGRHPSEPRASFVDVDNVNGARTAVQHLVQHGRRRIATITGPQREIPGLDRLEGYKVALREADVSCDGALVMEGAWTELSGYMAMQKLLPEKPDAVFIASDLMAMGALRALRQAGRRVPDDIAIVGFDDHEMAAYADPPLTTVHQPIYELGVAAVDLMLRLITMEEQSPLHTIMSTEFVIRGSCGCQS